MEEFVKKMISALTSRLVRIIVEQVQASITPFRNPSFAAPIAPASNVDEVDTSISSLYLNNFSFT